MSSNDLQNLDEEEEGTDRHMSFGDTFKQRADYNKGMMYEGRRSFLNEAGGPLGNLVPPPEFLTRAQSLKMVHMNSGANMERLAELAMLNEAKMAEQNSKAKEQIKRKQLLQRKKAVVKTITIDRFTSTSREDWDEEFLAGCRMWTNHSTGEVSEVCPWEEGEGLPADSPARSTRGEEEEEEEEEGTGAPVYDPSELRGLFDYLDTHPSPATSPMKK